MTDVDRKECGPLGRFVRAWFHPEDISDDEAFWGEGAPS